MNKGDDREIIRPESSEPWGFWLDGRWFFITPPERAQKGLTTFKKFTLKFRFRDKEPQ